MKKLCRWKILMPTNSRQEYIITIKRTTTGRTRTMALTEKAYASGKRMGKYCMQEYGKEQAIKRGSLCKFRYSREALRKAYDNGYFDAVNERD